MFAADIMTRALVTVSPDTPLAEVIQLLLEKRVGALPVAAISCAENGSVIVAVVP